jgi:ribosomal protein S18 acetylase RimI-like enzyme
LTVRPLTDDDRVWARVWLADEWGLPVVSPSGIYDDPAGLEGFVAEDDNGPAGLLLHRIDDGRCEVVALVVRQRRKGHGRALMEAARAAAQESGCDRVWLITTDENPGALAFYKSLGMAEAQRHLNFVDTVRRAKPDSAGYRAAFQYRDAIELEWR